MTTETGSVYLAYEVYGCLFFFILLLCFSVSYPDNHGLTVKVAVSEFATIMFID